VSPFPAVGLSKARTTAEQDPLPLRLGTPRLDAHHILGRVNVIPLTISGAVG
jgi:hypothetical protein